ncbi:MAG: glycosyltransferase family 87 protein [Sphingomonadaceae bacterium]
MFDHIANGDWLNRSRTRAIALMLAAATIILVLALFLTAKGTLDMFGRPLGTDFSNVWTAGRMALEGRAALAWDWPSHHAIQVATHGDEAAKAFFAWLYPPPFLLVAMTLALLPYGWALAVYQVATLIPAMWLARRIVPDRDTLLIAFAFPAVFVCFGHGHNGFLTASLLGGGMFLLDRRPFVAGLLIGCLIYKPQFGLVLPLVLLARTHIRAFSGACISALILIGVTLLFWGWPVWQAFIDSLPQTQSIIVEQGMTGWQKIQSAFSAARMWGASLPVAYAVQSAATLTALAGALVATRLAAPNVRNAVVIAASLLSTPYLLDYDLVVLGLAIAFLVADGRARGFLRWEKSLYALAWATPLFGRAMTEATTIPLGLIATVAIFVLALRRAAILDGAFARIRSWPFRRSHGAFVR